jgi:nucleoid-associated protein YgaU
MKTGKKSLSLLLAIIMVVSLLGGAFVVNAADAVTITLEATVGGETVTITATGLGDQFTALDMSTIGLPGLSGINNALWFDHDGTFSFDKDVTLSYQGTQTAELKAGEVANIADGIWSEFALTLDDGNFLTIVDKDNPGNFAYSPANTPLSEFPGTIGEAAAAEEPAEEEPAEEPAEEEPAEEEPAEEPAEEEPAEEEPAEEEPAEEEPAEEEPAAEGEGFVKTDALEVGKQYVFVAEYDGKYYAMTYIGGNFSAIEVEVAGDAVAPAEIGYVWTLENDNKAQSAASAGIFLFPYSGGMTYTDGRSLIYDGSAIYFITSDGTPGYVTFDGASFAYVKGNADAAAKMLIFTGEFSGEAAEPAEEKPSMSIFDYPHPETVRRDAVKNEDGSITLAFTSDTHYDGENFNLKAWLEAAEAEVGYIDAMGFCGDMGSAYDSGPKFWVDVSDVMAYMDEQIAAGKVGDAIYTTGNHEWFPSGGGNYSAVYADTESAQRLQIIGEAMTTEDYVIFCFGAGESAGLPYGGASVNYKYYQDEIDYFAEWLETAPTDIPIFVLTHYPLHAWEGRGEFRSQENAAEIIDILNEHPNLVVLWGHNHSDYDDNYYLPKFPGDEILIDKGVTKTINFTYLAAGCTADTEYTGPSAGSASVMNKGLIATINADGTITYTYYTIDGEQMPIQSPWLVRFRGAFGDYEVFNTQSVEDGQTAEAVTAPEVEGYAFEGWYTWIGIDGVASEEPFDFATPITRNTLVTAKYARILTPAAAPDAAKCVTVTPNATFNGAGLTMTAAGVGDLITVFDLSSIGYGTAIMYGFWFEPGGVVSFSQDVTLVYQGNTTDFTLKAGEFYSVEGFGEHYIQLDDGNDLLLLEFENPGNYKSYPGTEPYSAFPGAVAAPSAEPAPAPVEPEPAPAPAPAVEGKTYTVKEGDSLRSIAKEFYGTIFKWRLIYEANYDSMKGTDMIYVGQVLQIP